MLLVLCARTDLLSSQIGYLESAIFSLFSYLVAYLNTLYDSECYCLSLVKQWTHTAHSPTTSLPPPPPQDKLITLEQHVEHFFAFLLPVLILHVHTSQHFCFLTLHFHLSAVRHTGTVKTRSSNFGNEHWEMKLFSFYFVCLFWCTQLRLHRHQSRKITMGTYATQPCSPAVGKSGRQVREDSTARIEWRSEGLVTNPPTRLLARDPPSASPLPLLVCYTRVSTNG